MKMKPLDKKPSRLSLDKENPRLPEHLSTRDQDGLIEHIANEYNTLDVGRSMAEHGFFDSEPLIAVRGGAKLIVVEGNRRLAALRILTDEGLRTRIALEAADEWETLAEAAELSDDTPVPVQLAANRGEVAPIIGYRHIAGIEPWDPWAKARFLARQIDREGLTFEETSRIVGEKEADVRAHYRNYRVAVEADKRLRVSSAEVKNKFGFFTRAMNSPGLREHIGAPTPANVAKNKQVLKASKKDEVKELFSWLFGDDASDPVITDSRQISGLGQIVSSPDALKILRESRDFEEALAASGGVRERLLKRLSAACAALEKAEADIARYRTDPEVMGYIASCSEALARLG